MDTNTLTKEHNPRDPFQRLRKYLRLKLEKTTLYGITLMGGGFDELVTTPTDPWPGNHNLGQTMLEGKFQIEDEFLNLNDILDSPLNENLSKNKLMRLHGFDWLRDLRAIGDNASRRLARQLISHWINNNRRCLSKYWLTEAWQPDIVGHRLANWIGLYDFFCSSADENFRYYFFKNLDQQYRYLKRCYRDIENPLTRLYALKGLIFAASTFPKQQEHLSILLGVLEETVQEQLLLDGGHESRNPEIQLLVLKDLIDIRAILRNLDFKDPAFLQTSINQMAPIVRLFRHGDGSLANFNGIVNEEDSQIVRGSPGLIDMVLSLSDVRGRPPSRANNIGYERCSVKNALVLLNKKPCLDPFTLTNSFGPSTRILNFEWSVGRERLIHRGDLIIQSSTEDWIQADDFTENDDDAHVKIERTTQDGHGFLEAFYESTSQNVSFSHNRQLYISIDNDDFRGQDSISFSNEGMSALRFIFYPGVQISLVADGAIINLPQPINQPRGYHPERKEPQSWRFIVSGHQEITRQICPTTNAQAILLLSPLNPDQIVVTKWAFHLSH